MPKSWTWGTEVQRSSRWERDRKDTVWAGLKPSKLLNSLTLTYRMSKYVEALLLFFFCMQPWPKKELGFLYVPFTFSLFVASQGPEMLELDFVPCRIAFTKSRQKKQRGRRTSHRATELRWVVATPKLTIDGSVLAPARRQQRHTPVLRTKQWKTHCPRSSHWNISEAADIWSLGCIFFELLTGRFLFEDILPTVVSSVMRQASL